MSLHLNKIKVEGHDLKISGTLSLAGQDMSGQSSYTETAETGDKPKQISVRLGVNMNQPEQLQKIVQLAEAKNEAGNRVIYDILNATAAAMGIRRVKFQGDLSVNEDETSRQWRVSFKLTEVQSIPERKESRQQAQAVTDQVPTGDTVAASETAVPDQVQLSDFENVLQYLDNALAPTEGTA